MKGSVRRLTPSSLISIGKGEKKLSLRGPKKRKKKIGLKLAKEEEDRGKKGRVEGGRGGPNRYFIKIGRAGGVSGIHLKKRFRTEGETEGKR